MVFCFDLDDVLCNTYDVIMRESLEFQKKILNRKEMTENRNIYLANGDYYYFAKSLFWGRYEVDRFYHEVYPFFLEKCKPIKDSISIVNALKAEGHEIHIITARELRSEYDVEGITVRWLAKCGVRYDTLTIGSKDKTYFLSKLKCDYFVDDSITNCIKAKNTCETFCYITDYNRNAILDDDIKRIVSLKELYMYIE